MDCHLPKQMPSPNKADVPSGIFLLHQPSTFRDLGEQALSGGASRQVAGSQWQGIAWDSTRRLINNNLIFLPVNYNKNSSHYWS